MNVTHSAYKRKSENWFELAPAFPFAHLILNKADFCLLFSLKKGQFMHGLIFVLC